MKNLSVVAALIVMLFTIVSCRNDDDTPLPLLTLSCSNITSNTTLEVANYLVDCNVDIRNSAVLTILPGTKFTFTANGGLSTSNGGAIKATGTAEKPIVFTGKEAIKGFWKGININTNSLNNQFANCVFEYGGNGQTMVRVGGGNILTCRAVFTNCKFANSGTNGLFVNEQSTMAGSANNEYIGNVEYPVWLAYENVADMDGGSTFSTNTNNKIYVRSDNANVNKPVTFNKAAVPYLLVGTGGNQLKRIYDALVVKQGTTLEMSNNMLLEIHPSGYFNALGTATEKIIIRGAEQTKGYWAKIRFFETQSSNNVLEHCLISDGGQDDNVWFDEGMVTTRKDLTSTPRLSITNCRFSNSANYGMQMYQCGTSTATIINGAKGATTIKAALEVANQFPATGAADANSAGNVNTSN